MDFAALGEFARIAGPVTLVAIFSIWQIVKLVQMGTTLTGNHMEHMEKQLENIVGKLDDVVESLKNLAVAAEIGHSRRD